MELQAWPMFFSWDFSFSFLKPSGVGVGVGRNSLLFLSRLISFFLVFLMDFSLHCLLCVYQSIFSMYLCKFGCGSPHGKSVM